MTVVLLPVLTELPDGFDALRSDALTDGHTNMERLAADRASGTSRPEVKHCSQRSWPESWPELVA